MAQYSTESWDHASSA